jgi:hypothetical protein
MTSEPSQRHNRMRAVWLIGLLASGTFVGAQQAKPAAPAAPPPRATNTGTNAVTPVEGPSTLRRLGLTIEQTSIGSASWVRGNRTGSGRRRGVDPASHPYRHRHLSRELPAMPHR